MEGDKLKKTTSVDKPRGLREKTSPVDERENIEEVKETEEIKATEEKEKIMKRLFGIVTDCKKLNIRKEPSRSSEKVSVEDVGSELLIETDFDNENWYKVSTASGIDGYCMKEFVTLEQ